MTTPPARPDLHSGPVPWAGARVVVAVVAIYIVALAVGQVAVLVAVGLGLGRDAVLPALLLLSPVSLLAVTALWLRVRYGNSARRALGPRPARAADVGVGLGLGVACFLGQRLIVFSVAAVLTQAGVELPQVQQTFQDIAADPRTAPLLVVTAVLLAPLAEELVFRGVLFQGLVDRGFWVAALVSASMFTLAHLEIGAGVLANTIVVSGILPLGVAFAAVFALRGSLATAVVAHATYNALGVGLLILAGVAA